MLQDPEWVRKVLDGRFEDLAPYHPASLKTLSRPRPSGRAPAGSPPLATAATHAADAPPLGVGDAPPGRCGTGRGDPATDGRPYGGGRRHRKWSDGRAGRVRIARSGACAVVVEG
ncbi:hypothetical protein ACWD0Z_13835 [Streptomyces sp. NPDC003007]